MTIYEINIYLYADLSFVCCLSQFCTLLKHNTTHTHTHKHTYFSHVPRMFSTMAKGGYFKTLGVLKG